MAELSAALYRLLRLRLQPDLRRYKNSLRTCRSRGRLEFPSLLFPAAIHADDSVLGKAEARDRWASRAGPSTPSKRVHPAPSEGVGDLLASSDPVAGLDEDTDVTASPSASRVMRGGS
jgi:hypothetical protein